MCTPSGWAATLGVNTRVREAPLAATLLFGGGDTLVFGGGEEASSSRHTIRAVEGICSFCGVRMQEPFVGAPMEEPSLAERSCR